MWNFFKNLFAKAAVPNDATDDWVVHDETGTHRLSETDDAKLFQMVGVKNTCPDCGSHGFYEGPSGGMSTNIFCMNRECRSGFNITWFSASDGTCERIHKGDLDRYPKQKEEVTS